MTQRVGDVQLVALFLHHTNTTVGARGAVGLCTVLFTAPKTPTGGCEVSGELQACGAVPAVPPEASCLASSSSPGLPPGSLSVALIFYFLLFAGCYVAYRTVKLRRCRKGMGWKLLHPKYFGMAKQTEPNSDVACTSPSVPLGGRRELAGSTRAIKEIFKVPG